MKALISVSQEIISALFTAPMGLVNVPIKADNEEKPYRHWKDVFYC